MEFEHHEGIEAEGNATHYANASASLKNKRNFGNSLTSSEFFQAVLARCVLLRTHFSPIWLNNFLAYLFSILQSLQPLIFDFKTLIYETSLLYTVGFYWMEFSFSKKGELRMHKHITEYYWSSSSVMVKSNQAECFKPYLSLTECISFVCILLT